MENANQPKVGRVVPWLYCTDIDRSTGFYCDVLGFRLLGLSTAEKSAYLDSRGARIMLQEIREDSVLAGAPAYPFGRGIHLLLDVDDVDALHVRLSARADEDDILVKPRNRYYRLGEDMVGHREIVIKDPDGYVLRFYHAIEGLEEA